MCGRFTRVTDITTLQRRFSFKFDNLHAVSEFNIAPTQQILTVMNDGKNKAIYMHWGLIPSWARNPSVGTKMINARAETLIEKPSFHSAFRWRRCLILADSFYEWKKTDNANIPLRFMLRSGEPFAMAGLWDTWKDSEHSHIFSCTIVTTDSNALVKPIHNRMPVILTKDTERLWLDRNIDDTSMLSTFLKPYPSENMDAYQVSTLVNSPKNNRPEIITKLTPPA